MLKRVMKRILSFVLIIGFTLTYLPNVIEINTAAADMIGYLNADGESENAEAEQITDKTEALTLGAEGTTSWYYVTGSVSVSNTGSSVDAPAILTNGNCNIILCDDASLTVNGKEHGIKIADSGNLTIYAQSAGTGELTVTGRGTFAGIACESGSTFSIYGGNVTATGGNTGFGSGAGIGSGFASDFGTINIHGGIVDATGYNGASGIGGGRADSSGNGGAGGTVNIFGGTVNAKGDGAGIGDGTIGFGSTIDISGGVVTAKSTGEDGAGIEGTTIKIKDATVYAGDGVNGSGISGSGGTITISGDDSSVVAKGGNGGAGIDVTVNSDYREGATVTISGGTVIATGGTKEPGKGGAGIGGRSEATGFYNYGGIINIEGGTVTATGGKSAAGIGGGASAGVGSVTISGGTVIATGGIESETGEGDGGAGIGCGGSSFGFDGNVNILGGTVTATGGEGAAGIGSGSGTWCNTVISGGIINATGGEGAAGIGGSVGVNNGFGSVTISGGTINAEGFGEADIGFDIIPDVEETVTVNRDSTGVTIIGGSVNPLNNEILPLPKNSLGEAVYCNTLRVSGVSDITPITAGRADGVDMTDYAGVIGTGYGKKDVQTDEDGRLYFWLPQRDVPESVSVEIGNDTTYAAAYIREEYEYAKDLSVATEISLDPAVEMPYVFGSMEYGYGSSPSSQTFTVKNTGTQDVPRIKSFSKGDDNVFLPTVEGIASGAPFVAGGTRNIDVDVFLDRPVGVHTLDMYIYGDNVVDPLKITVSFTVNLKTPSINLNRVPSNDFVSINDTVTYTASEITNDGGSLSYRWYSNTENSNETGTMIDGATDASYSPSTDTPGVMYYFVEITKTHEEVETVSARRSPTRLVVREETPNISIDYINERLTGFVSLASYRVSYADTFAPFGGFSAIDIQNDWFGTEISIIRANENSEANSTPYPLNIPARPNAPGAVSGVSETVSGRSDGKIINVSSSMEYRANGGDDWLSISGSEVTGLAAGDYLVRTKATSGTFASEPAPVTIGDGAPLSYTLSASPVTFDTVNYGYDRPVAKNIVITNLGNSDATINNVTVSGDAFEIGGSGTTVASGGSINTWTIRPRTGLLMGTYTETIIVTNNNGEVAVAQVTFVVKEFDIDTNGVLTAYYGPGGAVVIPSNVTRIDDRVFAQSGITSVTFENGSVLESIGSYAFDGCTGISAINIPDSVIHLEEGAFIGCSSLGNITIPKNVEVIGDYAFAGCSAVSSVVFEADSALRIIGSAAFMGCGINRITVPSSVTEIGTRAFSSVGIQEILVESGNTEYTAVNGLLFNKEMTSLVYYPQGKTQTSFTIPSSVRVIEEYAFFRCSFLQTVEIHDNVTEIKANAFRSCTSLADIEITNNSIMTGLGLYAFVGCDNLVVFLPDSLRMENIQNAFVADGLPMTNATVTVYVHYDSDMAQWCRENGLSYRIRPSSAEMRANLPELMYEFIPYEFTVQTKVPNNEGLRFWLERADGNANLPAGLKLADGVTTDPQAANYTPGTIYGAPLNYSEFRNGVTFTIHAQNIGDLEGLYEATAEFTIKLGERLTNEELESRLNAYSFIRSDETGESGKIDETVTGRRGSQLPNQEMHMEADHGLFDSLWIDGVKKERDRHYYTREGSTRVTILSQTIQELDNGAHVAVAAFRRADGSGDENGELDIVAQNFTVDLAESDASTDPGGYYPVDSNAGNSNDYGPWYSNEDNTSQSNTGTVVTEPEITIPEDENEEEPEPENSGGNPRRDTPTQSNPPAESTAVIVDIQVTDSGAENRGTAEITGLATDENGNYLFTLDGSGSPMEIKINLPAEEFIDFYINGELWTRGVDYNANSNSAVITVPESRLEELGAGSYTVKAVFNNQTVEFTLLLIKPDVSETSVIEQPETVTAAETITDETEIETYAEAEDDTDENRAVPIIIGITGTLLLASVCVVIVKRRKGSG